MRGWFNRGWVVALAALSWGCSTPPPSHEAAAEGKETPVVETQEAAPPPPSASAAPRPAPAPWPPAPLALMPYVEEAAPGEGQWRPVSDVVTHNPGAPALMFQTTLRNRKLKGPQRDRFDARTFYEIEVVVWDPEQVHLGVVAGVAEPEAPLKRRGTGTVPQDPALRRRVVAAFNGGWRTKDAPTSGIMVDGQVGLPLAPGAATVLMHRSGRVEMGTWPQGSDAVPEGVHSFRQNIEPLWAEGRFNPLGRAHKWGGTGGVAGADGPYTIRSGLCRTGAGHMAYLYAQQLDAPGLAEAMARVGCEYGMHLDMNGIHAGFEYLRVTPTTDARDRAQVEAARLTPRMFYKPFPRYLDARRPKDFFYLVREPALPQTLGGIALTGLPTPGSARRLPPVVVGRGEGVEVVAWDSRRMPLSTGTPEVAGGLQLALHAVTDAQAPLKLAVADGAGGAAHTLATGRGLDQAPEATCVAGASGPLIFVARAADPGALRAWLSKVEGVGWLAVEPATRVELRLLAEDGRRWLATDGTALDGEVVKPFPGTPQGAAVFALPAEKSMVGDLFGGAKEPR